MTADTPRTPSSRLEPGTRLRHTDGELIRLHYRSPQTGQPGWWYSPSSWISDRWIDQPDSPWTVVDPEPPAEPCALCGEPAKGFGTVDVDGKTLRLCHADGRICYVRWTVYGDRPPVSVPLGEHPNDIPRRDGPLTGRELLAMKAWLSRKGTTTAATKRIYRLVQTIDDLRARVGPAEDVCEAVDTMHDPTHGPWPCLICESLTVWRALKGEAQQ